MADISDVERALLSRATAAIYPAGTAGASTIGADCKLYRGWPISTALNADLAAGIANVSVIPDSRPGETLVPRFPRYDAVLPRITLTATVADRSCSFAGLPQTGQRIGVLADGMPYAYVVQTGDTAAVVAANIANTVRADHTVWLSGTTITMPAVRSLSVRVVADAQASIELRRQRRALRLACWCPTPPLRDIVGATLDSSLASSAFLPLSDGTYAYLRYDGTEVYDQSQSALLYRRDLIYITEYATVETTYLPSMLFGDLSLNANRMTI